MIFIFFLGQFSKSSFLIFWISQIALPGLFREQENQHIAPIMIMIKQNSVQAVV